MKLLPGEEGQGLLEYALIFVLVIILVIVLVTLLGPSISNMYIQTINVL